MNYTINNINYINPNFNANNGISATQITSNFITTTNFTTSNLTTQSLTCINVVASNFTNSNNITFTNLTTTNYTLSINATFTNLSNVNVSCINTTLTNISITNNYTATNESYTNLTGNSIFYTIGSLSNIISTNFICRNFTSTTRVTGTNAIFTTLSYTNLTTTNLTFTNGNLNVATNATGTLINFTNMTNVTGYNNKLNVNNLTVSSRAFIRNSFSITNASFTTLSGASFFMNSATANTMTNLTVSTYGFINNVTVSNMVFSYTSCTNFTCTNLTGALLENSNNRYNSFVNLDTRIIDTTANSFLFSNKPIVIDPTTFINLTVPNYVNLTATTSTGGIGPGGNIILQTANGTSFNYSVVMTDRMFTNAELNVASSEKIKNKISIIENEKSIIDKFKNIEYYHYQYKDLTRKGDQYGLIADQINNEFNDYVNETMDYIPNLYIENITIIKDKDLFYIDYNNIDLTNYNKILLKYNNEKIECEYIIKDNKIYITSDKDLNLYINKKLILYGVYDSLLNVKKDALFEMNLHNTKHLIKKYKELKNRIQILKTNNNILIKKNHL